MGVYTWADLGKRRLSIDRRQARHLGRLMEGVNFTFSPLRASPVACVYTFNKKEKPLLWHQGQRDPPTPTRTPGRAELN